MTSAEALSIPQESGEQGYIGWDNDRCMPDVSTGTVVLDGAFSEKDLRALLVFFSASRQSAQQNRHLPG